MTRRAADWLLVSVGLASGASIALGYSYAFLQRSAVEPAPIVITKDDLPLAPKATTGKKAPEIET